MTNLCKMDLSISSMDSAMESLMKQSMMKQPDDVLANEFNEMVAVHGAKYDYGAYGNVLWPCRYYLYIPDDDDGPVVFYERQNDDRMLSIVPETDGKGQLCVRLRKQVMSRGASSPEFSYRTKLIPAARIVFDTFDNGCCTKRQPGKVIFLDGDETNLRPDNLSFEVTQRDNTTPKRPVVLYDVSCKGQRYVVESLRDAVAKFNFNLITAKRALEGKTPAVKSINSGHQFVIRYGDYEDDEKPDAVMNAYLKQVKEKKEAKKQRMASIRQARRQDKLQEEFIQDRQDRLQDEVD